MKNIIFWTPGKFKFIKFTWQNYRPPTHTHKLSKRILDPLFLINSGYLLKDLLTIKNLS